MNTAKIRCGLLGGFFWFVIDRVRKLFPEKLTVVQLKGPNWLLESLPKGYGFDSRILTYSYQKLDWTYIFMIRIILSGEAVEIYFDKSGRIFALKGNSEILSNVNLGEFWKVCKKIRKKDIPTDAISTKVFVNKEDAWWYAQKKGDPN